MAETWKQRLQRLANGALRPLGLHVTRAEHVFDMDGMLARAAARGVNVATWIDVGASDGTWSLRARRHFPGSRFVLFEPLAERQPALAALHRQKGFAIVPAAAGPAPGTVAFAIDPQLDGSGVAPPGAPGTRSMPVDTIDRVVAAGGFPRPFGIKLDTHGFELSVLEGAARVLSDATLLVIEAYNFRLVPECLRFHELCAWLEVRGFRCCDLADPMRRPRDNVLWQLDLAFVRADNPAFKADTYD